MPRPSACRRPKAQRTAQMTGAAAPAARAANTTTTPVMATTATAVAASGADHCQPMVSWAHMETPRARNAANEQMRAAELARACTGPSSSAPAMPAPERRATIRWP